MDFSARFKQLRKESGLTQQDIANVVFVDKTTVSKWELGANYPNQNVQTALADFFKVSVDYLLGRTDIRNANITPPSEAVIDMPIIGSVRGGMDGNVFQEETGETRPIATSALHGRPDEYFLLRVRGDSMYPDIMDGDCVLVKKTESVESGSMAVVLYDGDYATVKFVRYVEGEDWVDLISNNPQYAPVRIEGADLEQCHVLGEVVDIMRTPKKRNW